MADVGDLVLVVRPATDEKQPDGDGAKILSDLSANAYEVERLCLLTEAKDNFHFDETKIVRSSSGSAVRDAREDSSRFVFKFKCWIVKVHARERLKFERRVFPIDDMSRRLARDVWYADIL